MKQEGTFRSDRLLSYYLFFERGEIRVEFFSHDVIARVSRPVGSYILFSRLLRHDFLPFSRRTNRAQSSENTSCRIRSERPCPPSKYRTPSGACNNVRHPAWGARGSPFLRLLPPAYSDGEKHTLANIVIFSTFLRVTSNVRESFANHRVYMSHKTQ